MFRKILSAFISLIILLSASISITVADDNYKICELRDCKNIYSYSGSANAYFYGSAEKMLISSRVIPNQITRYISTSGYIRAVCHDENNAYALYDSGDSYGVVRMNMNSGSCDHCTVSDAKSAQNSSFAVCGNEIFIIQNTRTVTVVKSYDFSGKNLRTYSPPQGVERLFVNGGSAYVKALSGEIFRLSGGNMTKCAELEKYTGFSDAGVGYIFTSDKRLISLSGGNIDYPRCDLAVRTSSDTFKLSGNTLSFSGGERSVDSAKALCAVGKKAAVLSNGCACEIITPGTSPAQSGQTNKTGLRIVDDIIVGIEPEITVTQLKDKFPEIKKVLNGDRTEITSGKVKTGYYALYGGREYQLALSGDVNSSGTLNSADIDELMNALAGNTTLSDCCKKAADSNLDGEINTKDLVLLGNKMTRITG